MRSLRRNISDFIDKKINRLTIIKDLGMVEGYRTVIAICECGTKRNFNFHNVISGKSKSCGCLPIELNTKHGLHKHKLYEVWGGDDR